MTKQKAFCLLRQITFFSGGFHFSVLTEYLSIQRGNVYFVSWNRGFFSVAFKEQEGNFFYSAVCEDVGKKDFLFQVYLVG